MPIKSISRGIEDAIDFRAGDTIFRTGEGADVMFYVVDGEVEIRWNDRVLEVVGPGEIMGELAMVDDSPRSATAVAKTDCKLAGISREHFKMLVQRNPVFALEVMRVMADRLRRET